MWSGQCRSRRRGNLLIKTEAIGVNFVDTVLIP
jgi:hypothetical protein